MIRILLSGALFSTAWPASAQTSDAESDTRSHDLDRTSDDDIIVTGSRYRGEIASGAARIDAPVADLPLSISVLTEAAIEDRQLRSIRQLAENVAGVQPRSSGEQAFETDFTIRGFQGYAGATAVNGYRVPVYGVGRDPAIVERVEFLKGPASVLYGASGALAGLVNIVTKTPRSDNFLEAEMSGGQFGYGRSALDGNVRVSDNLDARAVGSLIREDSLGTFTDIEGDSLFATTRWRPFPGVSILAEGSYIRVLQPTRDSDTVPALPVTFTLPRRLKLGDVTDYNLNHAYTGRLEATWEVAPGLTLRQGVLRTHDRANAIGVYLTGELLAPRVLGRAAYGGTQGNTTIDSQTEVRWNFDTGPFSHKLLAGFEYADARFKYSYSYEIVDLPPLDLDNPTYGFPLPPFTPNYGEGRTTTKAGYIQDFIEYGEHWKLLAGLRYDSVKSQFFDCSPVGPSCTDPINQGVPYPADKPTAFSPRLGLVWRPAAPTTFYVSWSRSFAPNTGYIDRNRNLLPNERGTQYEVGLRQELLDGDRLTATIAAFDLTRSNIASTDPFDNRFSVAVGEQKSRGAEIEISGKPVTWIDLIATYAYVDAETTKSDVAITGIAVGQQLSEAPRNSASFFGKFALEPLGAPKTSFSVGVYYLDSRPIGFVGESASLPRLPAITRVDLGLFQNVGERLRLQANIYNLFDVYIREPNNFNFRRGAPFTATIGARVTL